MIIETIYDIGDTVWFMYNNKPVEGKIAELEVTVNSSFERDRLRVFSKSESYRVLADFGEKVLESIYLFTDKKKLLDSL